ncbi:hypothetical protein CYMTET_7192 [Cymbomonas tetramitiformis]|uniref:Uncharacterized protein n=1 Tax=Cymbomonas tetramitiformis TaxID=36881 RepID=A0AAE0LHQ2_9CHLO|nr:hypothetical protein CYMTET_7192 [Cymbomonas tetramitiformis]
MFEMLRTVGCSMSRDMFQIFMGISLKNEDILHRIKHLRASCSALRHAPCVLKCECCALVRLAKLEYESQGVSSTVPVEGRARGGFHRLDGPIDDQVRPTDDV